VPLPIELIEAGVPEETRAAIVERLAAGDLEAPRALVASLAHDVDLLDVAAAAVALLHAAAESRAVGRPRLRLSFQVAAVVAAFAWGVLRGFDVTGSATPAPAFLAEEMELPGRRLMSLMGAVPAGVPSLFHSSAPTPSP
jgi:hypothetical protein